MSYQALARKWRPRTFAELSGQEHVVRALTNALTRNRLHHAYLLTGTRGVGKTTIARILAKSLNCVRGVTPEPCGACEACTAIDAGRFVDLLELDAASNTGIDNMREILDNARYAPTSGRYKVYLIDEVHMLSKAAFNSMLKTLEEPPEHVKFVLATTDPQKIPVTVLSRCLQFNLKQLPVATIVERLGAILAAETIASEVEALSMIARAAHGSMRDALSLLDQAIAYGGGEVRTEVVRTMLGAVDTEHVYRLLDALIGGDGAALLAEAAVIRERSIPAATVLEELASLFHRIAVAQIVPAAGESLPDADRLAQYAAALDAEQVQLGYQICVQGRADLVLAPDEAMGLGMSLLRLLAFAPGHTAGAGSPPGRGNARPASPVNDRGAAPAAPRDPAVPPSAPARATAPAARPVTPRATPPAVPPGPPSAVAATPVETPPVAAHSPLSALPATPEAWIALVASLKLAGMAGQLAAQTEWRGSNGREITLGIAEAQRHLTDRSYVEKLRQAVEAVLGHPVRFAFDVTPEAASSLAAQERRERAEQKARAETAFQNEPFVRDVLSRFDARVKPDSVRPAAEAAPDSSRSSNP